MGRRVARDVPTGDANGDFFLSAPGIDANVVGTKNAPESDLTLWVLLDTDQMEDLKEEDLTTEARKYIEDHYSLFQVPQSDLSADARIITINNYLISVSFTRSWKDIPVRDANIEIIFSKQSNGFFRMREVINATHGEIVVGNFGTPAPSWDEIEKSSGNQYFEIMSSRQVIYTLPLSGNKKSHSLATEFTVIDSQTDIVSIITAEHETNRILEAYQNL